MLVGLNGSVSTAGVEARAFLLGTDSAEIGVNAGSPNPHPSPQVATDKDNGILLYKGDNDPLALELYQGHVRLVYDSLSSPPTTVYR